MSGIGIAHSTLAMVALALGACTVARPKGDRLHRTIGHLYFAAMIGTNITALCIYRLFGVFGPFHVAALLSLSTTVAGLVPVVIRRPRAKWFEYHAYFMSWSYVGLVAAAASEALVRLPNSPFAPAVFGATLGVTALGALLIHGRRSALLRRALQRAGVAVILVVTSLRFASAQATPAGANATSDATLQSIDSAITAANSRGDVDALRVIRERIGPLAGDSSTRGLAQHYLGYLWYREATLVARGKEREAALDSARALLERSLRLLPLAESHAILATIIGLQIDGSAWRGMLHGSSIGANEDRARKLDPTNPRVALLAGIDAYYAPEAFGGGLDRAERQLQAATEFFARDHPIAGRPSWGHAESWAWLGRVRAKRGNLQGARDAYEKALEIDPGYEWVRRVLISALKSKR